MATKATGRGFAVAFLLETVGVSASGRPQAPSQEAVCNNGQDHSERNIMRIALRIALAASAAMLALGVAHAEDKVLKLGTEGAYPPFNNLTADGKLEGFDIDIGNALCEQMQVKCEWVTQDWDGIIPALQAGKFDAIIASMSITPERAEKVDFSGKYYNTPSAIVVPKDSDLKGTTKADLAGKTIGVATSTTHFNYASQTYTDSTVKGYPSSPEEQLDLVNGRLDAIEDDIVVLSQWLETPDGACCKILGTPEPQPVDIFGPGAGIAVRKGDKELVDKLNEAIKAIRANGKYKEINDKYFKFDVYGAES
jgi:polar amino acid transport system substrate-binding protein